MGRAARSCGAAPPAIVFAGGAADKHPLFALITLRQPKPLSGNNVLHTYLVAQRSEILEVERKNLYASAIFPLNGLQMGSLHLLCAGVAENGLCGSNEKVG